jgi:hypothetical protein
VENNLLAHLSFKLTSQHEVIATEGLTYILQQSEMCRRALENLARSIGCNLPEIGSYQSEVTGDNLERPDIVGRTGSGQEALIMEGKFDAGLTNNQPNNYLSRLPEDFEGLLIFVVPEMRVEGLWKAVTSRAGDNYTLSEHRELPDGSKCANIGSTHKLMMVSWSNLLNSLLHPAQRSGGQITNDLLQLIALCNRIEGETFKPFNSEELTSTKIGIRHLDLCNLVDAIAQRFLIEGSMSTSGLRATPIRDGYVRYVRFGDDTSNVIGGIRLDYTSWVKNEISPIWLVSGESASTYLREAFKRVAILDGLMVQEVRSTVMLPLDINSGEEFSEIVNNAIERISKVLQYMKDSPPTF